MHIESSSPGGIGVGRFAPTPSGNLHLGNLRTAIVAYLAARSSGRRFVLRTDDLDRQRSREEFVQVQRDELHAIGLSWDPDGSKYRQSAHDLDYQAAIAQLAQCGLVYECYCTRREILDAPSAPHTPPGAYPGTCRDLSEAERARLRQVRPHPALRLRAEVRVYTVNDALYGRYTAAVDDFVLSRGDGTASYNLAVVLDDAAQGVDQVVRGEDLLSSAPRQAYLASLLGIPPVEYLHVPLVLNARGVRLAKRDGAVTLERLHVSGVDADQVVAFLLCSLGLPPSLSEAVSVFRASELSLQPLQLDEDVATQLGANRI
ncbi:MAG TPA: tRNA glutamyl-Q(34) synthetase GluQRS [Pseudoclavibacter sp.]|nr:tRNA glutamyl-Q(34) synthetase GluQRS [Pseudoclavibacter sp.]